MTYHVNLVGGQMEVVDSAGNLVSGGFVHSIHFPSTSTQTASGHIHHLAGQPTADISVPNGNQRVYLYGVPIV
jgi:hypothetical protein